MKKKVIKYEINHIQLVQTIKMIIYALYSQRMISQDSFIDLTREADKIIKVVK